MQQPASFPFPFLRQEVHELGHILGSQPHTRAAHFRSVSQHMAGNRPDAQGIEQPRPKISRHIPAGLSADGGGQQIGSGGIVEKVGAGLMDKGMPQKGAYPIRRGVGAFGFVATGHRQQIAHRRPPQMRRRVLRRLIRENIHQTILQRKLPLLHRKADGGGRQGFAERIHPVGIIRPIGFSPARAAALSPAKDHQAVDFQPLPFDPVPKIQNSSGRDSHPLGRCLLKIHSFDPPPLIRRQRPRQ